MTTNEHDSWLDSLPAPTQEEMKMVTAWLAELKRDTLNAIIAGVHADNDN